MFSACTSGVPPSSSVTTGVLSVTGSRSRYSSMTPRHRGTALLLFALDTHHRDDLGDGVERAELVDGGLEVRLASAVRDHHELCLVPVAFLPDRADRDVVRAERAGYLRENTGQILHRQQQVVLRYHIVDWMHQLVEVSCAAYAANSLV